MSGVVHGVPLAPRPLHPSWGRHPLPVAAGEVGKLCEIEQGASAADLELPAVSGPWPVVITAEPDADAFSAYAIPAGTSGVVDKAVRAAFRDMLSECLKVL